MKVTVSELGRLLGHKDDSKGMKITVIEYEDNWSVGDKDDCY
jgi:hypothetical protein